MRGHMCMEYVDRFEFEFKLIRTFELDRYIMCTVPVVTCAHACTRVVYYKRAQYGLYMYTYVHSNLYTRMHACVHWHGALINYN